MLHIVLVEPEIPPNTGNVGRLCVANDLMLHLIEPLGFEINDKALKRAGMDYWEHLQWKAWPNFEAWCAAYPNQRRWLFTTKTTRDYTKVSYGPDDALIFGRETKGLPESLLAAHPESCVTIPMSGKHVRSLNLATSVGIAAYEALRQVRICNM
jgi:tRNA (cytidine/uridine-2'-O-)-methyltransferase